MDKKCECGCMVWSKKTNPPADQDGRSPNGKQDAKPEQPAPARKDERR